MTEYVYIRNTNTGEIHRVIVNDAGRLSQERCNLDDIEDSEEISEEEAYAAPVENRCGHDFKEESDA